MRLIDKRQKNENIQNKSSSKIVLFIKVFILTSVLSTIVVLSVGGVVLNMIKPPVIPAISNTYKTSEPDSAPDNGEYAYLAPEGEEEDMLIGDGLIAPEEFTKDDRKESFYTFLIIGLDEGINTDTIMVASYDEINKEANIISIPRDSLVNVKRSIKKINAAYPAGTLYGGGMKGGVEQLKRELKTIIGFVPDYYVCIDLNAFVKIVDAVGGVDVVVPFDMKYDDPEQNLHIDIREGEQHLDGENALRFARYRKSNSGLVTITDYERIENQQTVIKAVLKNLIKPENILRLPEFVNIFTENVYTDIKPQNMLWFAIQLKEINGTDALSTYTMPTTGTSGLPMYYEYLDEPAIVELVNRTINPYKKDIEAKDLDIIGG